MLSCSIIDSIFSVLLLLLHHATSCGSLPEIVFLKADVQRVLPWHQYFECDLIGPMLNQQKLYHNQFRKSHDLSWSTCGISSFNVLKAWISQRLKYKDAYLPTKYDLGLVTLVFQSHFAWMGLPVYRLANASADTYRDAHLNTNRGAHLLTKRAPNLPSSLPVIVNLSSQHGDSYWNLFWAKCQLGEPVVRSDARAKEFIPTINSGLLSC